jgi:hypothetical protein
MRAVYSLGVYSLGVYSLAQRDLDPKVHSLGLGVYSLGIYSLGIYSLGVYSLAQRDLNPKVHSLGLDAYSLGAYSLEPTVWELTVWGQTVLESGSRQSWKSMPLCSRLRFFHISACFAKRRFVFETKMQTAAE